MADVTARYDQHFQNKYYEGSVQTVTIDSGFMNSYAKFSFNLTSIRQHQLESMLTTTAHRYFDGASVQCGENLSVNYVVTVIHIVDGIVNKTKLGSKKKSLT